MEVDQDTSTLVTMLSLVLLGARKMANMCTISSLQRGPVAAAVEARIAITFLVKTTGSLVFLSLCVPNKNNLKGF